MSVKVIGVAIDSSAAQKGVEDLRADTAKLRGEFRAAEASAREFNERVAALRREMYRDMADDLKAVADAARGAGSEVKKLAAEIGNAGKQKLLSDLRPQVNGLIEDLHRVVAAILSAESAMTRFVATTRQAVIEGGKLRVAEARPSMLSGSSPQQLRLPAPSQIIDATVVPNTQSIFDRVREIARNAFASITGFASSASQSIVAALRNAARNGGSAMSSALHSAGQATSSAFATMANTARGAINGIGTAARSVASGGITALRYAAAGTVAAIGIGAVAVLGPIAAIGYGAHRAAQAFGGWGSVFSSARGYVTSFTNGVMRAIASVSTLSLGVVGLGGLSIGFLAKSAIETSDAFTLMERKLMSLADGSFATFSRLSGTINDIAAATRSSIGDAASEFNRLHLTLGSLGNSIETTAALTRGMSAELKLSGASADESKRAMIQLSQWIGKGKADLQDMKSIRESAPGMMALIETIAGKSMAKIAEVYKAGGAEAQALTQRIFTGIANGADQAVEKLNGMPRTFEEAVVGVKNAWFNAVGAMQQRSDFMGPLNAAADRLAQVISSEAFVRGFSDALRFATETAQQLLEWVTNGGNIETTFMNVKGYLENIGSLIKAAALDMKDWTLPWWMGGGNPAADRVGEIAKQIRAAADEQMRMNEAIRAAEAFYGSEGTGVGGVPGSNGNRPAATAPRGNYTVRTPMPIGEKKKGGGGDSFDSMVEKLAKLREQNALEDALISGDAERIRNARIQLEIEGQITQKMRAQHPILAQLIEQEIRLKEEKKQQMYWTQIGRDLAAEGVNKLWDGMMKVGEGTMKMKDFMKQFLAEMIKATAQAYILKPILDSIKGGGSLFGGGGGGFDIGKMFGSFFGFANGGAFDGMGQVKAYASGGVFSSPTAFRHSGGLGVMGEAGPEAVMPLTRLPGGKLGVKAQGGNGGGTYAPTITVNVAGGLTAVTAEEVAGMIEGRLAMAKPSFIKDAKLAVRRENTDNPNYLRR